MWQINTNAVFKSYFCVYEELIMQIMMNCLLDIISHDPIQSETNSRSYKIIERKKTEIDCESRSKSK